jgi:hypothetical protein
MKNPGLLGLVFCILQIIKWDYFMIPFRGNRPKKNPGLSGLVAFSYFSPFKQV